MEMQRARVRTQCKPRDERYGVGTFLQDDDGKLCSPVMRDGAELYPWINQLGWKASAGNSLVYERQIPETPEPVYLAQTSAALLAYDMEWGNMPRETAADLDAADKIETRHIDAIKHAFARDTADRNAYGHASLVGVCRPRRDGQKGYLREWVERWRFEREHTDRLTSRPAILANHA